MPPPAARPAERPPDDHPVRARPPTRCPRGATPAPDPRRSPATGRHRPASGPLAAPQQRAGSPAGWVGPRGPAPASTPRALPSPPRARPGSMPGCARGGTATVIAVPWGRRRSRTTKSRALASATTRRSSSSGDISRRGPGAPHPARAASRATQDHREGDVLNMGAACTSAVPMAPPAPARTVWSTRHPRCAATAHPNRPPSPPPRPPPMAPPRPLSALWPAVPASPGSLQRSVARLGAHFSRSDTPIRAK